MSRTDKSGLIGQEFPPSHEAPPPSYPVSQHGYVQATGYQPQVQVMSYGTGDARPGFNRTSIKVCGAVQLAIGFVLLFVGIVEICMQIINPYFYNFWGPFWFILAGAFAVAAAKRKASGNGFVVTSMVFSILSSIASFTSAIQAICLLLALSYINIELCAEFTKLANDDEIVNPAANALVTNMQVMACQRRNFMRGMLVIDLIVLVAEFVTSIVQAAYSCRATCCKPSIRSGVTYHE